MATKPLSPVDISSMSSIDLQKYSLTIQLQQWTAHKRSSSRWTIFFILLALFLLLHFVNIRLVNQFVWDFWKASAPLATCRLNPWKLVMAYTHPWIQQVFFSEPMSTNVAYFLRLVLQEQLISKSNPATGLTMMCGHPCSLVDHSSGGDCLTDLKQFTTSADTWAVAQNPLWANLAIPYLAPIVSDFLGRGTAGGKIDIEPLFYLYTRGLYAFAENRQTYSPFDNFSYLYATTPAASKPCLSTLAQITSVAQTSSVWAMIGMVGGPPGAVIGGLLGAALGIAGLQDETTC